MLHMRRTKESPSLTQILLQATNPPPPIFLSETLPQLPTISSAYIHSPQRSLLPHLSFSLLSRNKELKNMSRILTITTLISLLTITVLTTPATSATDSFVFGGCSQLKYTPGSPYDSNVNLLLTSLVRSATFTTYSNFTIKSPTPQDTLYGLFQCRGDLSNGDCASCVARAESQLGTLCPDSSGGALQLEGCFVKYDNTTFLGVEDKTEVLHKCGPLIGYDSDQLNSRDVVLGYLGTSDGSYRPFRVGGSGDVSSVAQCVQDLSASECQDCLSEAIGRLKTVCGPAVWGDLYLAKCYVRFSTAGASSHGGNGNGNGNDNSGNDEVEKTLAILIGLIAAVALLVVFLSFLRKSCERDRGCK